MSSQGPFVEIQQLITLVDDSDPSVRMETAARFASLPGHEGDEALARILFQEPRDPYIEAACLSGAPLHLQALCAAALRSPDAPDTVVRSLASTAAGMHDATQVITWLQSLLAAESSVELVPRIHSAAALFQALEASDWSWRDERSIDEAVFHLGPLFAQALRLALDPEADVEARCDALEVTACDGTTIESRLLAGFVTEDMPPELAEKAVDLIQRGGEDGAQDLLGRVKDVGPMLRAHILSALLTRDSWTTQLLRVASDPSIAGAFDLAQRQRLRSHESPEIRELAEQAFGARPSPARALQVTLLLRKIDPPGDAALGKEVFAQQCAKCHRLDGAGTAVGPDLAGVTDRSDEALLQSILDPNRAVLSVRRACPRDERRREVRGDRERGDGDRARAHRKRRRAAPHPAERHREPPADAHLAHARGFRAPDRRRGFLQPARVPASAARIPQDRRRERADAHRAHERRLARARSAHGGDLRREHCLRGAFPEPWLLEPRSIVPSGSSRFPRPANTR
jgi:hypothetical protein